MLVEGTIPISTLISYPVTTEVIFTHWGGPHNIINDPIDGQLGAITILYYNIGPSRQFTYGNYSSSLDAKHD